MRGYSSSSEHTHKGILANKQEHGSKAVHATTLTADDSPHASCMDSVSSKKELKHLLGLLSDAKEAVSKLSSAVRIEEKRILALHGLSSSTSLTGDAGTWRDHMKLLTTFSPSRNASVTCVHAFKESISHMGLSGSSGGGIWSNGAKGRTGDSWGLPRVVAIGDSAGFLYLFSAKSGLLYQEYDTGSGSPITSMASYSIRRNESVISTGHENGEIRTHGVYEALQPKFPAAPQRASHSLGLHQGDPIISSIFLSHILPPGEGISSGPDSRQPAASIDHMAAFHAMGKPNVKRLVASWDANGWLRVLKDDGSVRISTHCNSSLLTARYRGNLLLGITPSGVSVLGVGLMGALRSHACVGLDTSKMVAAAFDPIRLYRAYAVTDDGDLLSLVIPHDNRASTCKVSKRVPLNRNTTALAALRGFLILSHNDSLSLINVTLMLKEGLEEVLAASATELGAALDVKEDRRRLLLSLPVTVVGHSNLVAMQSLDNNEVLLWESNLPIPRGLGVPSANGKSWTQPIFLILMVVVAVFQFMKARGQRHGAYASPAGARRLRDFQAAGGLGPSAAARFGSYRDAVRDLDRSAEGSFPTRAVRRAARMAPLASRHLGSHHGGVILEEDEKQVADHD